MGKDITKSATTACKQYCLAAGATQGNIAYTQTVMCNTMTANIKTKKTNKEISI
jgi:hypothetical protein